VNLAQLAESLASLEVLSFLAGRRDAARLLLLGSYRPEEAAHGASALQGIALRLVQRGQAGEMVLRPLSVGEVVRYLGLRLGGAHLVPVDELAAFIHRRTEGNALFVVSMIDDLVRRGELVDEQGRWRFAGAVAGLGDRLPETLRRLVRELIEHLSDEDRRLVEAAAVVGAGFCGAATAAALQWDEAETEDRCLRLALQGRLLERQPAVRWPDGTLSCGFRFLHALYWQGAHERVSEARRAEWQRRVALRLERAFGVQCSAIARQGDAPAGIALMREAIDAMQCSGGRVGVPYLYCVLAEAQLAAGEVAPARASV
jgi:predicted ATPase